MSSQHPTTYPPRPPPFWNAFKDKPPKQIWCSLTDSHFNQYDSIFFFFFLLLPYRLRILLISVYYGRLLLEYNSNLIFCQKSVATYCTFTLFSFRVYVCAFVFIVYVEKYIVFL